MSKTKRYFLCLLLIAVLLSFSTFVVFAKELSLLTISGPNMKGELALNDQKVITTLEKAGFFDQSAFVQPPQNLNMEAGYNITAYLNLDGNVLPYVEMVYYAADQGQPGYIHYTGRFAGEGLQSVDQWQILTANADNTFRGLMTANNITLQSALITVPAAAPAAEPLAAPVAFPVPAQTPYSLWALAAAILLFAGVGLALRRRAISQTTT